MALSICMKCLKYLVFVINLLFWLAGMGVLVAAIYIRCYPDDIEKAVGAAADDSLYLVTYIFMALGGLMTLVGFLGCCGAYQESPCVLATFIALLILILGGEVAGIVTAYMMRDEIEQSMEDGFKKVINHRNMTDSKLLLFSWLQENLHCCGSVSRDDWVCNEGLNPERVFECESKKDLGTGDLGTQPESRFKVPASCCRPEDRETYGARCGDAEHIPQQWEERTYDVGCTSRVMTLFNDNMKIIFGIIAGIFALEILILVATIALCCNMRSYIEDDGYMKP